MIVFTFPGQGSQKPGMGAPWQEHPSWELVDEASAVLGRALAELLLHTEAEELTRTDNAQLSTFLTSLIVLDAVERLGVEPAAAAGHSLGEYSALVASGALSFEDGLRLVQARGSAMLDATTSQPGTMAAVLGLDDDGVEVACARCPARRAASTSHFVSTPPPSPPRAQISRVSGRSSAACAAVRAVMDGVVFMAFTASTGFRPPAATR